MFGLIKGFSFKVVQLILYLVGAVKLFHLQNIKTDIDNLDHVVDVDVDGDLVVGSSRKAGQKPISVGSLVIMNQNVNYYQDDIMIFMRIITKIDDYRDAYHEKDDQDYCDDDIHDEYMKMMIIRKENVSNLCCKPP